MDEKPRKLNFLSGVDYFPWLDPQCFEDGEKPYLHVPGCAGCGRSCNERGDLMGRQYKWWKEGKRCKPYRWVPRRRVSFDDSN